MYSEVEFFAESNVKIRPHLWADTPGGISLGHSLHLSALQRAPGLIPACIPGSVPGFVPGFVPGPTRGSIAGPGAIPTAPAV